jgi:hypothetical protein
MLGRKVRLNADGTVHGRVTGTASVSRQLMLKVEWADGTVSWHPPGELTRTDD